MHGLFFSTEKSILFLDESTSSVDVENETAIYRNLFDAFPEKIIIASIHKMNLLKLFERIVFFQNGYIKEEGSFNDLLKKNDAFKKAWQAFSNHV